MGQRQSELDANAATYLNPTPDRRVDQVFMDLVSDFVIGRLSGDRVLELGAGDQIWTPKLAKKFRSVTTVDGSAELLKALTPRLQGVVWQPVCSLFEDYEPAERFQTVLMTYVLEHVEDPAALLRRAREKWLNEGGTVAVVVPHALSLHRRLAVAMNLIPFAGWLGETDRRLEHHHCFAWYDLERLLSDSGFRVVERHGLLAKPLPNSMLVSCDRQQLEGLFRLGLELPIEYAGAVYFLAQAE
jgi:2-polyprenyl-3-methyl-5-hydroxy-6-metoxy-1,4-benzoquinol methylase